jgi:hypothetical protein
VTARLGSRASVARLAAAVALGAIGAALLLLPAGALGPNPPGDTAPVTLTFTTPVTGLSDGSTVGFHVDASGQTTLNGAITSRICSPAPPLINNTFEFGFQGTRCVKPTTVQSGTGLTGAQYSKAQGTFSGVATSGDLTHNVGTGTVVWINDTPTGVSLTCDSSHPCDLVVQVNINTAPGVVYFEQALTFGGGTTTTTTTTTTQPPPSTTTTTTTQPPASTTTTTTTTTTTQPPASTTTTTTTQPPASTTTTTTTQPPASTTTSSTTTTTTTPPTTTTTTPGPITLSTNQGPTGSTFSLESDTWMNGTKVAVSFHSDPVPLGELTADDEGKVSGTFTVPAVEPGAHTVQLDGTSDEDKQQTLTTGFTVVPATTTTLAASGSVGGTTTTGTTSASGPLAITGASTRDLASAGLLIVAAGLVLIDVSIRRRARA